MRLVFLGLTFALAALAQAGQRGVINDPDGFVNVREGKDVDSAVIARVKTGEPFTFEPEEDAEWCKVTTAAGKSGWMHHSRIRLHFSEKDLPSTKKDPAGRSEIEEFAIRRGFDYAATTRRAARGDEKALKQFFAISRDVDGAAAESHSGIPTAVYHILGDGKFAKFLGAQPLRYQMMVRNAILSDGLSFPATAYLRRHFPETTKVLFRREIVDWFSPNERYAIRKVFSDEFDLIASKVVRAELIDRKSGEVLCDLGRDDIGTGAHREGEVLWSSDSNRVACVSSDLTQGHGNLFSKPRPPVQRKQTAVYQRSSESFGRIELDLSEVPGRDGDEEVKGAILGHEYTEPIRWESPAVLILERHEYYEKLKPTTVGEVKFESIHSFDRLYQIAATIAPDGNASVVWKLRKERP
jgi:hypothetical protein